MPKSKRSKVVSLTSVKTNRKEMKRDLVGTIQQCVDLYPNIYVFTYENMRTAKFKEIRAEWSDSRFFLGKNRVMQKALGDDAESAYRPGLDTVAADLIGNVGLLFTSKSHDEVKSFVDTFEDVDYARAGFVPSTTITIPAGRLEHMPHTMAETLTKLGMPVRLDKGVVVLPVDYTICKAGEAISPEQGRLLRHFGHQLATFKLHLVSSFIKGKHTTLGAALSASSGGGGAAAGASASARRKLAAAGAMDEDDDDDEDDDEE